MICDGRVLVQLGAVGGAALVSDAPGSAIARSRIDLLLGWFHEEANDPLVSSIPHCRPILTWPDSLQKEDRGDRSGLRFSYAGRRRIADEVCDIIEISRPSADQDFRRQFFIGADLLVRQVDTFVDGRFTSLRYSHHRVDIPVEPQTGEVPTPPGVKRIACAPLRLGAQVPDYRWKRLDGTEVTLAEIVAGHRAVLVHVGWDLAGASDAGAAALRALADADEEWGSAGLGVVGVASRESSLSPAAVFLPQGSAVVLAADVDRTQQVRGLAGATLPVNGRPVVLLNSQGRIVFAANSLEGKASRTAFRSAMLRLGFAEPPIAGRGRGEAADEASNAR